MRNKQKSIILLAVLGLILAAGAIFFSRESAPSETVDTNPSLSQEETDSDSGFKTYRNKEYGFSFEVPEDTDIVSDPYVLGSNRVVRMESADFVPEDEPEDGYAPGHLKEGFALSVSVQDTDKSIEELSEFSRAGRGGPAWEGERKIKVGGHDALLYTLYYPNGNKAHVLWILKTPKLWVDLFFVSEDEVGEEVFDRVVSSFDFEG